MTKNYLQIEFSSGNFFQWSGTEKEGFEKHVSPKDSSKISYRKYFKDGIKGTLESVNVRESDFGEQLSMTVKDGDNIFYIPINIFDGQKHVDNNYAESLIKLLPVLQKDKEVLVRGYNFTPEGDKYAKIGISITQDGVKLKSPLTHAYYKDGVKTEGDIPAIEWEEKKVLKTVKRMPTAASLEKRDAYLLGVIEQNEDRLKWVATGEQQAPKSTTTTKAVQPASPQQAFESANSFIPDAKNDLPF